MPKPTNTRRRVVSQSNMTGKIFQKSSNPGQSWTLLAQGSTSILGRQITTSEGHHWPPPKGAGLSDRGGPFSTTKQTIKGGSSLILRATKAPPSTLSYYFHGTVYPCFPTLTNGSFFPPFATSSDVALDALGATAIARCVPTNPVANASTFLGELMKDGLPHLIGSRGWESKVNSARKKAADEYLNVQFGWLPIVSDIKKFAYAIRHADSVLAQFERDSGKVVRRRYNYPLIETTEETVIGTGQAIPGGVSTNVFPQLPSGEIVRRRDTRIERSFSGAFTYYLPSDYDSRNGMAGLAQKAEKLFGIDLTPEVLWNISPWSWAVDWFSNTGDVIRNISRFGSNGLVLRYGYMTEHSVVTDTYTLKQSGNSPGTVSVAPLVLRSEAKVRRPANPYGFGVSWNALSTFQASILAALGISRRS
jgi:hypothetical protein